MEKYKHQIGFLTLMFGLAISGCASQERDSVEEPPGGSLDDAKAEEGAYFTDVTASSGIDFVHTFGDNHLSNIVETVGSGAAFFDFDLDGYQDLYIVNGANIEGVSEGEKAGDTRNRLYRNIEGRYFVDVSDKAGVTNADAYGMGVTVADYDNDGDPDIYVSNYGANTLFRNNGDGTFTDAAKQAGVDCAKNTVGSIWFDYDNDGHLDLYVGNYLEYDPDYTFYYAPDGFPGPFAYDGQPDVLYRNKGDGTFEDVTEEMGVHMPHGKMMGIGACDYDQDGFVDLYIANDAMGNYFYRNEAGTKFSEIGLLSGTMLSEGGEETSSMAVDFADYNLDGRIDLFVSDIHFSALYRNDGQNLFTDVTTFTGIAAASGQYDGWGASFVDFDNDGDADIIKVNGDMNHLYGQEDQVFENKGDGRFQDVSLKMGSYFFKEFVGRGACFGDYDNDGDIDAVIVNLADRIVLLRNESLNSNSWIEMALVGVVSNRDGVGARVRIVTGEKVQLGYKKSASGYLSQNDPRLHFGLGSAEKIDLIEITWPSGRKQVLENIDARRIISITEPADEVSLAQ